MNRVAILGLGLMGGSLGLALRRRGYSGRIVGYARRPETREVALADGAVDEVAAEPQTAVRDADVVVICVPILATAGLVEACVPGLKQGAVVTDVGSTKAALADAIGPMLAGTGAFFVGSHPIAGSEQQGLEGARADLYEGATVVVTPGDGCETAAVAATDALWRSVGARIVHMPASNHDEILARTSHLPHMIAAVLASTVGRGPSHEEMAPYCGTGYRDTTRIAAGSPAVWMDILRTNRRAIAEELTVCREVLAHLIDAIREVRDEDVEAFLQQAKQIRESMGGSGDDRDG